MEHSLASAAVRETAADGRGPGSHILPSASARARAAGGQALGLGCGRSASAPVAGGAAGTEPKARIADDSSCRRLRWTHQCP
jgi:hypothetical protein